MLPHQEPRKPVMSVKLVDSVWYGVETGDTGFRQRVAVQMDDEVDTIPQVLTRDLPVVKMDSVILGLAYSGEEVFAAFQYHPHQRHLDTIPLVSWLPDYHPYFSGPAFSLDGAFIAYVALQEGRLWGVVRRWSNLQMVAQGPEVGPVATGFLLNGVKWDDAKTFAVLVDMAGSPHPGWLRVRGTVDSGILYVDTLSPQAAQGEWWKLPNG
jgi:hypothetical protein